jgi:RsiW-degrading membrane proteinase PrsW (M82 family)
MYALAVVAVSTVPGIAFMVLILRMDRREPEPLRLVAKVVGLGAAGSLVAALVELALDAVPLFQAGAAASPARAAAVSFLQVAPVEEACKIGVVLLFVWRNPAFNEENDGIVYVGASALGFALLENVLFVARGGIGTGVLRAFTAIPLHIFTGIVAGLFVGRARFAASPRPRALLLLEGFGLAWLFHGLYDTFAMSQSALALLLLPLLAGVSAFGVVALKKGRNASLLRWDGPAARDAPSGSAQSPTSAPYPTPSSPTGGPVRRAPAWMAVVSRILLAACALFWALLAVGVAQPGPAANRAETILGGILLTIIPASLGATLEVSYHRRKARAAR